MRKTKLILAGVFLTGSATLSMGQIALEKDSASGVSLSATDSLPSLTMTEFVVTGARTEKSLLESGRSISVITSAEIQRSGANNLAELLAMTEGVFITGAQQSFGANQSLFLRGSNSNQSVVMLDGIALTDPSTPTHALDLSELSLNDIDRIEIVRGSHSTLYGSAAIGGVINIITKKGGKKGLNLTASGTAGSFGESGTLVAQNVNVQYRLKNGLYASLAMSNSSTDGMNATIDTTNGTGMPKDKDRNELYDYSAKIGYSAAKWEVFLAKKVTEKSTEIDDREFDDDDNYMLGFNRQSISYGIRCKVDSGFSILFNGSRSAMERDSENDSSLVDNAGNYDQAFYRGLYSATILTNELQFNLKKKGYSIVLGGGMNEESMNQEIYSYFSGFIWESNLDSLDLSSRTHSFFLLTELEGKAFSEKLRNFYLTLGARSNKNNTFGSSFTYQVNPLWKLSAGSSLYANLSSGYNAPSLYQLHSPDKDFMSSISRGNVNLLPERSTTSEWGIYQKLDKRSGIRFGYFQTLVEDVIEYVYLWNKNTPVNSLSFLDYMGDTYMNLGSLRTEGLELDVHGQITRRISFAANFSIIRGKYLYSYEAVDTVKSKGNHVQLYSNGAFVSVRDNHSQGLVRRPVTANISLTWEPNSRLFVKPVLRFVSEKKDVIYDPNLGPYGALGKIPVGAYLLTDLIAGFKWNQQFSALVRIENLTNESYSEIRGYSARGRGIYLTANYSF